MLDLDPLLILPFLLVLGLMALPILSRKWHGPVAYIQPQEVSEILERGDGPPVLDIRTRQEFEREHIPGTHNASPKEILDRLTHAPGDVVLICQSDTRSIKLAGQLRKAGVEGARVLQGGLFRWKRSRLPTIRT